MILVTGGSGSIGSRLIQGLHKKGRRCRALVLPGDANLARLDGTNTEIIECDVADAATIRGACEGCDTVYHLAAVVLSHDYEVYQRVNVGGMRNLLEEAQRAHVDHFVHVSSASVVYPKTTPYSRSKRHCEKLLTEQKNLHWTIVRPTLVYDVDGGEEFARFWAYLRKYPVVPFIGSGRARKNPVYVQDLVSALVAIAGNPSCYEKTYALCGGEDLSIRELAELMLNRSGDKRIFVHLPVVACQALAVALRVLTKDPGLTLSAIAGVTQDADLDRDGALRDLGYEPIGIREGIAICQPPKQLFTGH